MEHLTEEEIADVEASLKEIAQGKAKKFDNVEDFLRDLADNSNKRRK